MKHSLDCSSDFWVLPVEIRLFRCEEGKEVLVRSGIISPLPCSIISKREARDNGGCYASGGATQSQGSGSSIPYA